MASESSILSSQRAADLLSHYSRPDATFDHLLGEDNQPRAHWQPLVDHLHALGPAAMAERWSQARRLIHDNGVTYNVYGDPRGMERPWELDALPLVIPQDEWRPLEKGLLQRALLLDLILADVYGPQRLVAEGLLPAALVHAHPGFLRACHGLPRSGERLLHLYAVDLGRGPDGGFCALGERTQAPSGMGYALENRIVLSRTLPEAFGECRVQRLALFFRNMREMLASLAPHHHDNPRIVLLTPGPHNETYFEQAYLARYLGLTLVEGGDLTVRDHRVYLKTLGGLQQIDVILRRQDDDFCDPLELRANSTLGVPGLVEAVRAGHVAVANALGSGWAESPALMPWLPQLCRRLLGQELLLPSVPTWWCGQEDACRYVLDHLAELVIKPAFASMGMEPVFGDQMTPEQRATLTERIRARPIDFVAQQRLMLASGPVWAGDRIEPRRLMLRTFLAAAGDGYQLMPGGLTRVSPAADTFVVSMQKGGGSKDTWVTSDGPVSTFSMLPRTGDRIELSRGGGDLPSRTADNLFWLGRYSQRAEAAIRILRSIYARLIDHHDGDLGVEMPCLLRALTHMSGLYPGFIGPGADRAAAQPEPELRSIIFDDKRSGSVRFNLNAMRRVAAITRDRLSTDAWRILGALDQEFDALAMSPEPDLPRTLDLLNRAVIPLSAFGGLIMESMTRGVGWTFLNLGRWIERAVQTTHLLRATLVDLQPADESMVLEAVLQVADSAMTYRRRYLASLQPHAVLDLLLADETNPRSIAFQIARMHESLHALPGDRAIPAESTDLRIVIGLLSTLRLAPIDRLCRADSRGVRADLDELLDRLYIELPALSDALSHTYLSHTTVPQQLAGGGESLVPSADSEAVSIDERGQGRNSL
jgi:uncharacterized circularly permuted ATP-grasp superfamily protein/uncharacterized alpha-E superfamily protein